MKQLISKIANIRFIVSLRNNLGIYPKKIKNIKNKNISISDAFFWRTDDEFETTFKFSNLPNLFYNDNSNKIEIHIYNKNNKFLKKIYLSDIEYSNKFIINKVLLNNIESYGTFYIYHKFNKNLAAAIRNSCYTGYSKSENIPSFVHGNCPTTMMDLKNQKIYRNFVSTSFFCNQKYKIQNRFDSNLSKCELMINNPTQKKIKIIFHDKKYFLDVGETIILESKNGTAEIISDCYFLRPIIFNHKDQFIDVYHG